MPLPGKAKDTQPAKKTGIISGVLKKFHATKNSSSKSSKKKAKSSDRPPSNPKLDSQLNPAAEEIITLSSGSEDSGVRRSSSPEDSQCLDRISDVQAPYFARKKPLAKKELNSQGQSDSDLSEGEIRDGDSGRLAVEDEKPKKQKPLAKRPVNATKADAPRKTEKSRADTDTGKTKAGEKGTSGSQVAKVSSKPKLESKNKSLGENNGQRDQESSSVSVSPGPSKTGGNFVNGITTKDDISQKKNGPATAESVPLIQVSFLNSYLKTKYDSTFRKLIEGIIAREQANLTEIYAAGAENEAVDVVYHDCFEIDTNLAGSDDESSDEEGDPFGLDMANMVSLALPEVANAEVPTAQELAVTKKKSGCFNCGGNHNLYDCTEPLDHAQINKRKQEFFNSAPMAGSNRYHENVPDEDRVRPSDFPDCGPGKISADLQSALGLDRKEVPPWILRMRSCGFPPGYIRSCVVEKSGLDFIHEVDDVAAEEEGVKFDFSKLPSYPGFSAPFTREVQRGPFFRHYEEPLLLQSNDTVIRLLQSVAPAPSGQPRSPSPEVADMDMSDEETSTRHQPTFVCPSVIPASPDASPSKEIVSLGSGDSSRYASQESLSSIQGLEVYDVARNGGMVGVSQQVSFEIVETLTPVTTHQPHEARVLKSTSMMFLNSVVKSADLPHLDSFAAGVPLFVHDESPSTGRYHNIRNTLAETRKRKRDTNKFE
ncbi:uncharacterized protein LOC129591534 isoform X2 [Paramacrobiotus metropolitanus]|uniref:uncharacterized protein LOC129591534 isoform X2 n=1 Tax=Paramacrobiotus metropolitanus TaxID=2943436 RepID=UPI00244567A8|nr:uncharacterized protein LOC129591534 isoform X2 [Paramacrobiotus metropolitanus]